MRINCIPAPAPPCPTWASAGHPHPCCAHTQQYNVADEAAPLVAGGWRAADLSACHKLVPEMNSTWCDHQQPPSGGTQPEVEGRLVVGGLPGCQPRLAPLLFGQARDLGERRNPCSCARRDLGLLNDRAEVVAHRLMTLDPSSTLWGTRIREIREACSQLHREGTQVRESSPMLLLDRGRRHCTASRLSCWKQKKASRVFN